jgi:hypothetical protein
MKTNCKHGCIRLVAPAAPACGAQGGADKSRNRKTYECRLAESGLTKPPVAPTVKKPTQKELAQLAVSLAKDAPGRASAGELTGRALEIWKAASSAVFVEEMASYVVKGLCIFNGYDWNRHCRSLVALLDDARGAVPGQSSREQFKESARRAQVKAGEAVALLWKQEQRDEAVIRALFPGKGETADTRYKKLLALLDFAKRRLDECSELDWIEDGKRLRTCLQQTWEPLGIPADELKVIEVAAQAWLHQPHFVEASNLSALPMLARWLSMLRMEQAAEAKNRA